MVHTRRNGGARRKCLASSRKELKEEANIAAEAIELAGFIFSRIETDIFIRLKPLSMWVIFRLTIWRLMNMVFLISILYLGLYRALQHNA